VLRASGLGVGTTADSLGVDRHAPQQDGRSGKSKLLNKALATAPFASGMVGRFPEAPISFSTRKAGLSDGQRPYSNDVRAALVDEPMAQFHGCAMPILKLLNSA
jgi:hypothetical protein